MKVLVAEDDPTVRYVLQRLLTGWGFDVVSATDGDEAWARLNEADPPSLALLDWDMPGRDGVEICRGLRQSSGRPYTYTILLTVKAETEHMVSALDAGADDYLSKPFHADELKGRLNSGRRIMQLNQSLRFRAAHDALTNVWNREQVMDHLDRELSYAARTGITVSVALLDLDDFKRVNDDYGHLVGDVVLREVAGRMRGSVRREDAVGRYGGEEFMLVLRGGTHEDSAEVAERVRRAICGAPITTSRGELRQTASVGLAVAAAGRLPSANDLVSAADEALYRAKAMGKNVVESALVPVPALVVAS
jgi:diguanylate cyclase (GGDEF)-like protein